MSEKNITLTKTSFVTILDLLTIQNPNDPFDQNNSIGPVINPILWKLMTTSEVQLEPWRFAFVTQLAIDRAVGQFQSTELLFSESEIERGLKAARASIRETVDYYCGTAPLPWPLPYPWPLKLNPMPHIPLGLLTAGAQFHKAANAVVDTPLQQDFIDAADQLFEAGIRQIECAHESPLISECSEAVTAI